jgi:hypothetical protein
MDQWSAETSRPGYMYYGRFESRGRLTPYFRLVESRTLSTEIKFDGKRQKKMKMEEILVDCNAASS